MSIIVPVNSRCRPYNSKIKKLIKSKKRQETDHYELFQISKKKGQKMEKNAYFRLLTADRSVYLILHMSNTSKNLLIPRKLEKNDAIFFPKLGKKKQSKSYF